MGWESHRLVVLLPSTGAEAKFAAAGWTCFMAAEGTGARSEEQTDGGPRMTLAPKIAMSDDFLKSFAAVPRDQQQAVLTFVAKFRQNPTASGINYERIRDAGDPNMRSVRVNDNIRGIVLKPDVGNVYCLMWVDRHDDAYQWARRHRVAIHPDVGSIQIYASGNGGGATEDPVAATVTAAE
jgi:hypothetical protein